MPLHRWLILSVLTLNGLVILDNFVLPVSEKNDIYAFRSSVYTHGYRTRGYTSDYLVTGSGPRYPLPDGCYIHRTDGEPIFTDISFLFRRLSFVGWCESNHHCYKADTRMLTHSYMVMGIVWGGVLFAGVMLALPSLLTARNQEIYLWLMLGLSVINFICFFF